MAKRKTLELQENGQPARLSIFKDQGVQWDFQLIARAVSIDVPCLSGTQSAPL